MSIGFCQFAAVKKNQVQKELQQPPEAFFEKCCSSKEIQNFMNFLKRTPEVFYFEYCNNFKNSFFHKTPPVTASESLHEV